MSMDIDEGTGVVQLLAQLRDKAISLALKGDELAVRGETQALVPSLLDALRANKPALIAMLKSGAYVAPEPAGGSWVAVPANLIPAYCDVITPGMLPLIELTQDDIDRVVATVPGGVGNVQDIYPLSPLQEGMLFHHLMVTQGDMYLAPTLLPFDSPEQVQAFVEALRITVARHDVLRTAVLWEGLPEPVQVVWRNAPLSVENVSLAVDAGDIAEQLQRRFDPAHHRIDIRQAPMLRLYLAHDAAKAQWLLMVLFHHLPIDHGGMGILQHEVLSHMSGNAAHLPPPVPYRNFVAQARLGIPKAEHEAFFRALLGDVDEPTSAFGLTDVQGGGAAPAWARLQLDGEFAARMRRSARAASVSMASLCHLAWALVLARCSDRDDVVFGTVLSARLQGGEATDQVLGLFMNTLPVRVRLGELGVRDGLRAVHGLLAQLLHHEHASLVLAQRCSAVAAPVPLFSALLNYRQGRSAPTATRGGATADVAEGRTNYPLSLDVDDLGEIVRLTVLAQAPADPQRVCGYMQQALEQLLTALEQAPARPLRELDVLPANERRQMLLDWNATHAAYPRSGCVHELFEAHAALRPDAIALAHEGREISYAALNAQANRLAHHLRRLGVQTDDRVALCLPRSEQMVVAMLAVLKAGGGYVPLDPSQPAERLTFMLGDAAPIALLADGALPDAVRDALRQSALPVLDLHADAALWADLPGTNLAAADTGLHGGHLAYVIYTSGSTGKPKGVMVEHRQLGNLLAAHCQRYRFGPNERVLQFASMAFDVSVEEIFCSLVSGATLVLRTDAWMTGPVEFWRLCAAHRITIADLPTLFWEQLAHDRHAVIPATLRQIVTGGEAVSERSLALWFAREGHRPQLSNAYGPTEATINASIQDLSAEPADWKSIGRPIANTQIYLLGLQGQPVPVGVAGELCIGGAGVARGYLNQPEMTAERFIADPFSAVPGARLYKTGDLARHWPDGRLEFVGRNDFQVKIRGYRIEPGEIEARLLQWPGLREAAVLAREDQPGDKRLVAYCVGVDYADAKLLQAHLAATLPTYMVPATFVMLDALPLTPSGKLDRKALPAPRPDAGHADLGDDAPQGEVELRLAAIWADVLQVPRVGRHDDFFALGGHSLLAIRLTERMRRTGLAIDVRSLFSTPTIAALAAQTDRDSGTVQVPANAIPVGCKAIVPAMLPLVQLDQEQIDRIVATVPGGAVNVQDIYPLAPMQEGILFHHLMPHPGDVYLDTTLFGVRSRDDVNAFRGALQAVIDRHDILRTAILWEGLTQPVQVVLRDAPLPFQEVRVDATAGDVGEQLQACFDPRRHRIDVRRAPLLHLHAAWDGAKEHWVLLLVFHHLVADHTTLELMREEVALVLQGQANRLPAPLPFRNFVAQARLGVSDAEHEAFFRSMLDQVDEPSLPFGLADVHGDGTGVEEARRTVDPGLARRLRARAKALGVSAASLCHLAFGQVLARACGRNEVVFGTVLFGRMQGGEGADRALGLFINTLPILVRLGQRGVLEGVSQVHATLAQLMHHEHASLGLAQRCSAVAAPSPLFSALLNYRYSAKSGDDDAPTKERSNFPLTLNIDDSGDGFDLTAQLQAPVDPRRVCDFMHQALESIVDALECAPQSPLCTLEVLSAVERHQVLHAWNDAQCETPSACIHELFELQAAQTPNAIAICHGEQRLRYGELNAQANRLAHHLRHLGVGPDTRVALCLARSEWMVVALLAVLKAGGAYVPLDPAYPLERLNHMLQDSTPVVLLTDGELPAQLDTQLDRQAMPVLDLRTDAAQWAGLSSANPTLESVGLNAHNLAYLIYTSGSTGTPKGVLVEHRQVTRLFSSTREWFHFGADDVWTLFHSFAFDFSVWEIWGALLHGGQLVIVPQLLSRSPAAFYTLLCQAGVTVLNQTPSAFRQLLGAQADSTLTHRLRTVVFGGEALEMSSLKPWYARAANQATQLVNMYGITETTVHVTYRPLVGADAQRSGASPIGQRIPDLRVYVLDAHRQPVPIGVAGELYVGGAGVARGYLNRMDLTAQRFIEDPFHGGRMYKTGDLGRYLPDGQIEYLGRNDFQVKIRGFRIELGEIEAQLARQPGIRQAIVLAREDSPGDLRLVAYCVTHDNTALDAQALRTALGATLPEHMLPAAFVRIESLPLTNTGKLDREALPAPDSQALATQRYEAPQGDTETQLAQIWAEVLKVERVGRQDDFFALGGHSMLAIRMLETMRQRGLSADVRALFDAPTLAAFAAAIEDMEITL